MICNSRIVEDGVITNAVLDLVVANNSVGAATIGVYGLNNGDAGESWVEGTYNGAVATGGEIVWSNAPANDTASSYKVLSNAQKLGTYNITTNDVVGSTVSFRSRALADFINDDSDGRVTLIIQSVQDSAITLKSKEDSSAFLPPTLRLVIDPDPGTVILIQ